MMIDDHPDESQTHLVEPMDENPNQYWRFQDVGGDRYTVVGGGRCLTATAARQHVASLPCDGRSEQSGGRCWSATTAARARPARRGATGC
ncbi:RICIN domain-containing protein [Kitasatospora sp. NPDC057595]|uniref:RICIN domain-containing protein n=1 Tax=Kitasatospora sp. NPDC057595 TaxID=3346177 RepID=UPI0036808D2F